MSALHASWKESQVSKTVDLGAVEARVVVNHLDALTDLQKLLSAYHPGHPMGAGMRAQYTAIMKRLGWCTPDGA